MSEIICKNCFRITNRAYRKEYCGTCYNKLLASGGIPRIMDKLPNMPDKLTPLQKEYLTGLLLGDGHITKQQSKNQNSALYLIRAKKDKEYLIENYNMFKDFCSLKGIKERVSSNECLKKYSTNFEIKELLSVEFCTRHHTEFTNFRKIWYPDGIKIIPKSLKELTPLMIAIWLCDDGTISNKRSKERFSISLFTNGFTKQDVEYLISLLEIRYKEKFILEIKDKKYPVITCHDAAARVLLKDIDNVFPGSMKRKSDIFRDEEANFYKNIPQRCEPKSVLAEERTKSSLAALKNMYDDRIKIFNIKTFAEKAQFFRQKDLKKGKFLTKTNTAKIYINKMVNQNLIYLTNPTTGKYQPKLYSFTTKGIEYFSK